MASAKSVTLAASWRGSAAAASASNGAAAAARQSAKNETSRRRQYRGVRKAWRGGVMAYGGGCSRLARHRENQQNISKPAKSRSAANRQRHNRYGAASLRVSAARWRVGGNSLSVRAQRRRNLARRGRRCMAATGAAQLAALEAIGVALKINGGIGIAGARGRNGRWRRHRITARRRHRTNRQRKAYQKNANNQRQRQRCAQTWQHGASRGCARHA